MVVVKKAIIRLGNNIIQTARWAWAIAMHRPKALFLAGIIIGSFFGYTISVLLTEASYRLTNGSVQLIGDANPALADKLKLDKNIGAYRFNADAITPEMTGESDPSKVAALLASQKQQTGGGGKNSQNLYSLDLPIDPSAGVKIYDANSKTSFKLIPEFEMNAGRTESGRVVYPLDEGGQAVYTVKANGIKEDIVLQKPRGNELSFKYKLELPKTLEARLDGRGNLGIYSVDPTVSSAIAGALQSGASSIDTERLKDVQENGTKDHLTYLIPAPTIIQSGDQPTAHKARAIYKLDGDTLTVSTSGLETLTYPVSIDPSVVVTSTSDFVTGNNEDNISFTTDAISRGALSAGTIGAWTPTTSLATAAPTNHASVAYNGYLYTIGGYDGVNNLADVQYAPINANGSIGTWVATTSLPSGRNDQVPVVYNGYLYVTGGFPTYTEVQYAPINADGTIGTWTATTSLPGNRYSHTSVAYAGYIYIIGGQDDLGVELADVQYAPINADGTIGTWTATASFTTARSNQGSVVYDGYLYIIGGQDATNARLADVQYAPINANGTIGTWTATTSFTTARSSHATAVYNGYMYVVGGWDTAGTRLADVQYAPINANGTIGTWTATTSFTTARSSHVSIIHNGYMYVTGGNGLSGRLSDVQYAKIDGFKEIEMSPWTLTTLLGTTSGSGASRILTRSNHASATYNGYIYLLGGVMSTGVMTNNVQYAPLNATGGIGAWDHSPQLLAAPRAGLSAIAVNGYLYAIGGQDNNGVYTTTAYYSQLNATTGAPGAFIATAVLPTARSDAGLVNYNGYMYITGGLTTGNGLVNTVHYAVINTNGTLGAWTATTNLSVARAAHSSTAHNGYLYVVGGNEGSFVSTVLYAPLNTNGTVGTWNSTTSMSNARGYIDAQMYQGHIFVAGGNSGGGVYNDTSIYAKVNADGTLGAWQNGTTFTSARNGHGTDIYNGYIYVTGGSNATNYFTSNYYAPLSYGPASMGTTRTWQTATATNLAIYGQTSVVYNNFVYLIGGYGSATYRNDVRYAPINADGTVGTWTTSPNTMNMARFNGAAAAYNGHLYVTGGQQAASTFTNTTAYAPINADGTIGTWTTSGNVFTTARYGHVTAAYNGKLYVIGGGDAANVALGDVKYATINADGTIGTWSDTTATTAARDTDGFIYGGRLYILGGLNGTTYSNTIRQAPINTDGTIGTWITSASTFTNARSRMAAVAANGYVYISGGGAASPFGDLQYASISTDGSIGAWKSSNSLSAVSGAPAGYYYHSMIIHKGGLYSFAGIDGNAVPLAATYTTTLNAPAHVGQYSRQINLGQPSTLNSIVMNGVTPPDQTIVMFRTAGSDGVYGTWQLPSVLSGAPATNVQYVTYKVSFDDSNNSSLAATGGYSSVTDITADYSVPAILTSENRLRQNKYFDGSGVLQPLQTQ